MFLYVLWFGNQEDSEGGGTLWWGVDFNCIMAGTLREGLISDERGWREEGRHSAGGRRQAAAQHEKILFYTQKLID
jgi:hypothetical protein